MVTITEMSREFTPVEKYLLTVSPGIKSMKDVEDGTSIPVAGFLTFVDTKDTGEEAEIMSIITPGKAVYSCQSATFKRSLRDIAELMGDTPFAVLKISGKTKANRDFINCTLDLSTVTDK